MKQTSQQSAGGTATLDKLERYCQLQVLGDAAGEPGFSDRFRLGLLRLVKGLEKRLRGGNYAICQVLGDRTLPPVPASGRSLADSVTIEEGDWVQVLSVEEILAQLDGNNRTQGLEFLPGMAAYCGQRYRVLKQVRLMFDERAWQMVKIRNTYLLEGCMCDGQGMYEKEGCDRCCFYYWKRSWLQKLD